MFNTKDQPERKDRIPPTYGKLIQNIQVKAKW